jgi:hypothetical protein
LPHDRFAGHGVLLSQSGGEPAEGRVRHRCEHDGPAQQLELVGAHVHAVVDSPSAR